MIDGKPEIYLAGPEVFLPDPWARARELKAICAARGAVGWFPMDNQDGVLHPDPDEMASRISRAGMSISMRSPSCTNPIAPPLAASGETWPMLKPDVPPEKRPSVSSAQTLPMPLDFRYEVGYSISCMPGPPFGPS